MKKERVLVVSVVLIVLFGLIMIYSSSYIWAEYKFQDAFHYVKNQAIFAIIGFLLMHLMSKIDYHWYKEKIEYDFRNCHHLTDFSAHSWYWKCAKRGLVPGLESVH